MRGFAAGGSGGPDMHGFWQKDTARAGTRYYSAGNLTLETLGTVTPTADKIYAYPVIFGRAVTLANLYLYVSTAPANAKAHIGIYNSVSATAGPSGANTYPNALLYDSGEIDCSGVGRKTAASAYACAANTLYWLVDLQNNGGAGVATVRGTIDYTMWGLPGYTATDGQEKQGWQATQAYGALPATFPTVGSTALSLATVPGIFYSFV